LRRLDSRRVKIPRAARILVLHTHLMVCTFSTKRERERELAPGGSSLHSNRARESKRAPIPSVANGMVATIVKTTKSLVGYR
jgi:hypothetical protein